MKKCRLLEDVKRGDWLLVDRKTEHAKKAKVEKLQGVPKEYELSIAWDGDAFLATALQSGHTGDTIDYAPRLLSKTQLEDSVWLSSTTPASADALDARVLKQMALYEVTNGKHGFSYVRVYVWASSEERALRLAKAKFKSRGQTASDGQYDVEKLFSASDAEFVTEPDSEGWLNQ